jgi:hypothetical protein
MQKNNKKNGRKSMTFKIDEGRLLELAAIEAECNCDIIAGVDYGPNIGRYIQTRLATPAEGLNHEKLVSFLEEELGERLPSNDIENLASELELRVQERIAQRQSA